jgi:hypothetical protein
MGNHQGGVGDLPGAGQALKLLRITRDERPQSEPTGV